MRVIFNIATAAKRSIISEFQTKFYYRTLQTPSQLKQKNLSFGHLRNTSKHRSRVRDAKSQRQREASKLGSYPASCKLDRTVPEGGGVGRRRVRPLRQCSPDLRGRVTSRRRPRRACVDTQCLVNCHVSGHRCTSSVLVPVGMGIDALTVVRPLRA